MPEHDVTNCERQMTLEEMCENYRGHIQALKGMVAALHDHPEILFENKNSGLVGANIPKNANANKVANITIAFRHLEDARMRLGKVMQACQGGISNFDKEKA